MHTHDYVTVVRRRGNRVRRQCSCLALSKWERVIIPVPTMNPVELEKRTVTELRKLAVTSGVHGSSRMTKAQLIERLTEVR